MQNSNSKFIENTKFFFTDFHKGFVNIVLHIISFIILFKGLASKNIFLVIVGFTVIDEIGHLYNYFYLFKKDQRYNPIRMLPYQILYGGLALLILLKIFKWF